MKIAFFIYNSPCKERCYITSLRDILLNMGHHVEIFSYFNTDVTFERYKKNNNTKQKIYKRFNFLIKKYYYFIYRYLHYIIHFLYFYFKTFKDLNYINNELKMTDNFDFTIGIEKGGLICSYFLFKHHNIPFFYFSLELYLEDNKTIIEPSIDKFLRKKEINMHKYAKGTIISDKERLNTLYNANKINNYIPGFFLPVSFSDNVNINHTDTSLNDRSKKYILLFGINRIPDDFFIRLIKIFPNDYIFLMHNYNTDYHEALSKLHSLCNIQFSNNFADENGIMSIIKNSYIGICWYNDDNINETLTAFSSEKAARYLSAGKPIIANIKTNYNSLFNLYKCGVLVNTPEEFIKAIICISNNYEKYSSNALLAYNNIYKSSNYEKKLNDFLIENIKDNY